MSNVLSLNIFKLYMKGSGALIANFLSPNKVQYKGRIIIENLE